MAGMAVQAVINSVLLVMLAYNPVIEARAVASVWNTVVAASSLLGNPASTNFVHPENSVAQTQPTSIYKRIFIFSILKRYLKTQYQLTQRWQQIALRLWIGPILVFRDHKQILSLEVEPRGPDVDL